MAKKPERTIPETTDAETVVHEAEDITRQIGKERLRLEDMKATVKEQREVVEQLQAKLEGLFADENRPLLAMGKEAE